MSFRYFRFSAGTESAYEYIRTSCDSTLGYVSPNSSLLSSTEALHDSVNRILLALDTSTLLYATAVPLLTQAISIGVCEAVTSTEYFGATTPATVSSGGSATTDASLLTSGTLSDARLSGNVVLSSSLAAVATSGAYSDLTGKPSIPAAVTTLPYASITGTPTLAAVATTGAYSDLTGKPTIPAAVTSLPYSSITGTPTLSAVATSGSYVDLTNKPTIPAAVTTLPYSSITGTPTLATVATSGSYVDLTNTPTIPSAYSLPVATASVLGGVKQGSNTTIAADGTISVAAPVTTLAYSAITGTPSLATVATSGSYADLTNKPTIPSAYTLPNATASVLGGITVSTGLSVSSGAVSVAYGTSGTTACAGNDSRLSDSRTPTSHTHGNLTNDGAIGSTSGQIVVTTTSGVLTTASSIASSAVSGLAASATTNALVADNISSGTLPDARISATYPSVGLVLANQNCAGPLSSSTRIEPFPIAGSATNLSNTSGTVLMTFFTPMFAKTVASIQFGTLAVVTSSATLIRFGLYTFDEASLTATLVARTASDTTIFAAVQTAYSRTFSTVGGYPSSYSLQAGTRYGVALIIVATTAGGVAGRTVPQAFSGASPRQSGSLASQSDLPTSVTVTYSNNVPYFSLV
jgi:hypothetical protein